MATTYEKIASVTVGSGGAADIEFTSIAADWDDLVLQISARNNRSGQNLQEALITFNSNGSNYSERMLRGDGSNAISATNSITSSFALNGFPAASTTASTFGSAQLYIPNYAGSTNKSVSAEFITENNGTQSYIYVNAMLWSDTSAITSIKIGNASTYLWVEHSTAVLYGIKKS